MNRLRPPPPPSDHYTYSSALKACALSGRLLLGKSIHCRILRRSASPPRNRVLNNSLLNMYACCVSAAQPPSVDVVQILFDRMPNRNVVSWNTVIAWYVRSQRPCDALALFNLMVTAGIRPTPVSFINAFPAVVFVDEGTMSASVLYGLLLKHGRHYVDDPFVISTSISMFCELGDVQSARQVFDQTREKNIAVWNTMMTGYMQNEQFLEAINLFVQILQSQAVAFDAVTFLLSLVAVSQLQDRRLGQQVHSHLIKEDLTALPVILWNALIVMYSRCGHVKTAFDLFNQMPKRDAVSWNTMITALVQNDLSFEGLLLVYGMQKQGLAVDSVTTTALLSAASNLGSLRIGKEAHGYLVRHGIHCQGMESYLIDMYAKSGYVEAAQRVFDSSEPDMRDQATWNAMITGYTHSGQIEQAMSVFCAMLEDDQEPNAVTLSSILPACGPVGGTQSGKQIHGFAMRHFLDANVFVGTALVDMYSKCGNILAAERVFDLMAEKNTVTYTTMLSGFGQHGLGTRALSLFHSMQASGKKPDAIIFVALMSACSYSGLIEEGLSVYKSMEKFGIKATPEHHCCVVDLLARAGRVEEAYEFVQGLGERGECVGIWASLLSACKEHGKSELGKFVSEKLFEIVKENENAGYGVLDAGYGVLLSHVYAADGDWDNVDRVRKEMRARALRKEPGSSWIEVEDGTQRFMSRVQTHRQDDQIYWRMRELASELRFSSSETLDSCLEETATGFNQQ